MTSKSNFSQEGPDMNNIEMAIESAAKRKDSQTLKDIIAQAAKHPDSMVTEKLEAFEMRMSGMGFFTKTKVDLAGLSDQTPDVQDKGSVVKYSEYEDVVQSYLKNYTQERDALFGSDDKPGDRTARLLAMLAKQIDSPPRKDGQQETHPIDSIAVISGQAVKPDVLYANIMQTTEQVKEVLWEVVHEGREASVDMNTDDANAAEVAETYRSSVGDQFELAERLLSRAITFLRDGTI